MINYCSVSTWNILGHTALENRTTSGWYCFPRTAHSDIFYSIPFQEVLIRYFSQLPNSPNCFMQWSLYNFSPSLCTSEEAERAPTWFSSQLPACKSNRTQDPKFKGPQMIQAKMEQLSSLVPQHTFDSSTKTSHAYSGWWTGFFFFRELVDHVPSGTKVWWEFYPLWGIMQPYSFSQHSILPASQICIYILCLCFFVFFFAKQTQYILLSVLRDLRYWNVLHGY